LAESIFDKEAEPGKYFYCENGKVFKSIKELELALLNCSSEECMYLFNKHVLGYKNDFSAWIRDVFGMQELAKVIFPIKKPQELSKALAEHEKKINKKDEKKDEKIQVPEKNKTETKIENKSIPAQTNYSNEDTEKLKTQISERLDRADIQFDRVKKIKNHSFYNKADFDDSIESLKNRYDEINHSITEHRKEGKDMSIPFMMLRNVLPKINYFQVSQNKSDYDFIVESLDEIEKEINYSKEIKNKDLQEEVMEALGVFKNKQEE
jgi:hypothetical protein